MTYQELHWRMIRELSAAGIENANQEARWMGESVLADFALRRVTGPADVVPSHAEQVLGDALRRRVAGEPLQYILGSTEFYGLELETGPGVLIPRPETECLVDLVLRTPHAAGPVLDLCCGSGAIALALAANLSPSRRLVATDQSETAVATTRRNAERLGLAVEVRQGDLFAPVSGCFAVIVTNPPYVSNSDYALLDPLVRDHEPASALRAGEDGLDLIRRIIDEAPGYLVSGGRVYCEIAATQGADVCALFEGGEFSAVQICPDQFGRDRIVTATTTGV